MIRSEYGHLIRTKSSGQIFTPSHSSALMGRCTGWWRRSRGSSEGSSPASSPASRDSSSASSSSSSFSPSVFAGVPTSYKSGDRPCWCPRRQVLIISRAWTDQHLQPSVMSWNIYDIWSLQYADISIFKFPIFTWKLHSVILGTGIVLVKI